MRSGSFRALTRSGCGGSIARAAQRSWALGREPVTRLLGHPVGVSSSCWGFQMTKCSCHSVSQGIGFRPPSPSRRSSPACRMAWDCTCPMFALRPSQGVAVRHVIHMDSARAQCWQTQFCLLELSGICFPQIVLIHGWFNRQMQNPRIRRATCVSNLGQIKVIAYTYITPVCPEPF